MRTAPPSSKRGEEHLPKGSPTGELKGGGASPRSAARTHGPGRPGATTERQTERTSQHASRSQGTPAAGSSCWAQPGRGRTEPSAAAARRGPPVPHGGRRPCLRRRGSREGLTAPRLRQHLPLLLSLTAAFPLGAQRTCPWPGLAPPDKQRRGGLCGPLSAGPSARLSRAGWPVVRVAHARRAHSPRRTCDV